MMDALVNTHFCGVSVHADVSRGARRHRTPCILLLFASTHNMNMCVSSNSHKYMLTQTVCDEYERPKHDSSIYIFIHHTLLIHHTLDAWDDCLPDLEPLTCDADQEKAMFNYVEIFCPLASFLQSVQNRVGWRPYPVPSGTQPILCHGGQGNGRGHRGHAQTRRWGHESSLHPLRVASITRTPSEESRADRIRHYFAINNTQFL